MEHFSIPFQVVADFKTGRNMQSFFDNRSADFGSGTDCHIGKENGFFDKGVFLDGNCWGKYAFDDAPATDDAACGNDGIDSRSRMFGIARAEETGWWLVPIKCADWPVIVVQVERRILCANIHVCFPRPANILWFLPVHLVRCWC